MTASRALLRVVDELLWVVRRSGIDVSTSQALDVARIVKLVGWSDRTTLRDAIASVVVSRRRDRGPFERTFADFFGTRPPHEDLWQRLGAEGFTPGELKALRDLLDAMAGEPDGGRLGALLERGPELDRLLALAETRNLLAGVHGRQAGFFAHKAVEQLGVRSARDRLARVRIALGAVLGERADAIVDALSRELDRTADEIRADVRLLATREDATSAEDGETRRLESAAFTTLLASEVEAVRRAVRLFVERLRGSERVRARRARLGRIDIARTMRTSFKTGGVPFVPARREHRRDKARLVLLCDVSDSVRAVSTFLLEFVYAAQDLFAKTRSFVFVSELGETTKLFQREPIHVALGHAYGGGVISVADNSNYGRVLAAFAERILPSIDRGTTVVILGDGRTNYHDDGAHYLDEIRQTARALVWLCPEPRSTWATGDSAMRRYAGKCTEVLQVRSAEDLEAAARRLVVLR